MASKKEPRWMVVEQRGGRENYPLMPSVLTLYRIVTSDKFFKASKVKYNASFLLDFKKTKDEDYVRNCVKKTQWNRFCHLSYQKVKREPDFQKKLIKEFKKRVPQFLKFCKKVFKDNLKKINKKELWQYYQKYIRFYEDIYVWGEPFAFGARFKLSDYLSQYLKKILKKKKEEKKLNQYFNTLISPTEKPFITEEREKFLKIGIEIIKNPKFKKIFKQDLKTIKKEIEKYPALNKKIEKHKENYQWVPYNYGAFLYTKDYFLRELKDLIKKDKAKTELKKIENQYKVLTQKQKKIIKELKIDNYHQKLFENLRLNNFIIDYKKRIFTISHFYINFSLIKEIAERLGIEQKYAHCLLKKEMGKALLENKLIPLKILKTRFKRTVAFVDNGEIKLTTGKEAEDFLEKEGIREEKLKIKEFKGKIANPGKVKGRARIIPGPKEFKKMKRGDILVTHMTTPEFTPILKKAKAIVTDEGGITSHAAIVSRELGIPCVIGTQIATKVLKDGQLVEVDANKGVVKILRGK